MAEGVSDQIRDILNGYKHSRFGLGEAMARIKKILYKTNSDFEYRGKMKKATEWHMTDKCPGCGIILKFLEPDEKAVLDMVTYCRECYHRRLKHDR